MNYASQRLLREPLRNLAIAGFIAFEKPAKHDLLPLYFKRTTTPKDIASIYP